MGRLIDADVLKKHYSWWDNEEKELFDSIVDVQPTAYSPKSVMAEIETYSRKVYGEINIIKILSIVRKGGVE